MKRRTQREAVRDLVLGANRVPKGVHLALVIRDREQALLGLEDAGEPRGGRGLTNVRLVWSDAKPYHPRIGAAFKRWKPSPKWAFDFGPTDPDFGCNKYDSTDELLRKWAELSKHDTWHIDRMNVGLWADSCSLSCSLRPCLWALGQRAKWRIVDYPRREACDVAITVMFDNLPTPKSVRVAAQSLADMARTAYGWDVSAAIDATICCSRVDPQLVKQTLTRVRKSHTSDAMKLLHRLRRAPTWNGTLRNVYERRIGKAYHRPKLDPERVTKWTDDMTTEAALEHEARCMDWWWQREELTRRIARHDAVIQVLEHGCVRAATGAAPPSNSLIPEREPIMPRVTRSGRLSLKGHFIVLAEHEAETRAALTPFGVKFVAPRTVGAFLDRDTTAQRQRVSPADFLCRVRDAIRGRAETGLPLELDDVWRSLGFRTRWAFTKRLTRNGTSFREQRGLALRRGGEPGRTLARTNRQ